MKRTTIIVTVFAVVLAVLPVASAADDLVAEMELEITIRKISEETLKQARQTAWENVKKTTLYAKAQRVRPEWKTAVPVQLDKKLKETSAALAKARAAWEKARGNWPRTPEHEELRQRMMDLYDEHSKLADQSFRLAWEGRLRFEAVWKEVTSLVDKFARKIYRREMTKRLTELKVKITEKVLERIDRSYKRYEA